VARAMSRVSLASRVFGPATSPLLNYKEFTAETKKTRPHFRPGSKAADLAPALRSLTDARASIVHWDKITNKANIYKAERVQIPGKGGGVFGRVIKLTGKDAIEEAKNVMGRARDAVGLWQDMRDFMLDQKAVRKLARARFAPVKSKSLNQFARAGQLPAAAQSILRRYPGTDPESKSADRTREWIRGQAKGHAGAAFGDKKAKKSFKDFLDFAGDFWGIKNPKQAANDAEEIFGKDRGERNRIRAMKPDDFMLYISDLNRDEQEAAMMVRVGIVGNGLTENRQPKFTPEGAILEFLALTAPFAGIVVEADDEPSITRCVHRLRRCFA